MASGAVRRNVALLVILAVSVLLYVQARYWSRTRPPQHGSTVSGEVEDWGYQPIEGVTLADGKELAIDDNEELTIDDNEELAMIANAELVIKDIEEMPINEVIPRPLVTHGPGDGPVGSETMMPVLHRRDFKKLPKWDFEDEYTRSDHPRQTTCPLSLWNSEDESFKKNFIPDINLFMYNASVAIGEWNRLSHFNNPFGFMDYAYSEVKAALQNIQKPQEALTEGRGCVSCAVVGTAGILSGSRMGPEIDRHDYVFRMNGAITQGYEEDVGSRTSVYLHTGYSLTSALAYHKTYGLRRFPHSRGIKYVMIPESFRDFQWLQALFTGQLVSAGPYKNLRPTQYYAPTFNERHFYLLHPDFLRYLRNRFLRSRGLDFDFWAVVRPSNGAIALFLALHTCDVVNAYGFITEDYRKYPYSYYKGHSQKMNFYFTHDYLAEMNAWKKLHNAGIIKLYQRTAPPSAHLGSGGWA